MNTKQIISNYFKVEDADQALIRVALVLGAIGFSVTSILAVLLRLPFMAPFLLFIVTMMSIGMIYVELISKDIRTLCLIYLVFTHLLIMPMLSFYVPDSKYDFPVYFIIGIVFTATLESGLRASILMLCEILIDIFCFSNMFEPVKSSVIVPIDDVLINTIAYLRFVVAITITGTLCGIIIAYRNYLLKKQIIKSIELQHQAEDTNYAKDMFLVNVSHEIRTPLNAILGTTELIYDLDAADKIQDNTFQIANASKALLSITNDLMTFSQLESYGLHDDSIYNLEELFNDLINTFSIRYADSSIEFLTEINPDIPLELKGDVMVPKQIILNMLTDVIRSMTDGQIRLCIDFESLEDHMIKLLVDIHANGSFSYSVNEKVEELRNTSENNNMTILGNISQSMGGNCIGTENGNDRLYQFSIHQEFVGNQKLTVPVDNKIRVLFYENTYEQKISIMNALKLMKIDYFCAENDADFCNKCTSEEFTHILIAKEKYPDVCSQLADVLPPQSIIILGEAIGLSNDNLIKTSFLRPISCLNLDALFHHKKSNFIRNKAYTGGFVCPEACIMVVDDNLINLEVASGILKRYEANVVVAASGVECLNMLAEQHVDLVFLDYMMPEMDGIDTLKNIRKMDDDWLKQVPVVALTANAVSGAREMFMSEGFDEYISKPIELDKMDKVLRDKLPEQKIVFISQNN